jgi:hypothetical protein
MIQNNSPALTSLISALQDALYKAGNFYKAEKDGITSELVPLMIQHGLENVQTHEHMITYHAGTPERQHFIEDIHHSFHTVRPYIQKWVLVENYDTLYQQALEEIQQPDFVATWRFVTVWGTRAPIIK